MEPYWTYSKYIEQPGQVGEHVWKRIEKIEKILSCYCLKPKYTFTDVCIRDTDGSRRARAITNTCRGMPKTNEPTIARMSMNMLIAVGSGLATR